MPQRQLGMFLARFISMQTRKTIRIITCSLALVSVLGCHGSPPPDQANSDVQTGPETMSENDGTSTPEPGAETEPEPPALYMTTLVGVSTDCGNVSVFFETDSAKLKQEGKQALDQAAECLKGTRSKEDIQVTGMTDPRGSEGYNEELAQERAQTVVDYLKEKGVADDQFEIYARGEEGVKEGDPKLWPKQRRAVVAPE